MDTRPDAAAAAATFERSSLYGSIPHAHSKRRKKKGNNAWRLISSSFPRIQQMQHSLCTPPPSLFENYFFFYPIENKSTDNDNDDDLGFVGSGGLNVELNDVATKADGKNGRKAQKKWTKGRKREAEEEEERKWRFIDRQEELREQSDVVRSFLAGNLQWVSRVCGCVLTQREEQ